LRPDFFAQLNGRPIDKKADYDAWRNLLKSAGVRHVRLHDGRHTAATLLLSEGVHPRVVMELLGHSQMRTTMDIYSHVMPALAREAADRMGAALLGDPDAGDPRRTTANARGLQPIATKAATRVIDDDLADRSRPANPGGAEGTRTPDPHTASVVRYQLRHSPRMRAGLGRPRLDRTRARPCDRPREPQREEPRECDQRQPKI